MIGLRISVRPWWGRGRTAAENGLAEIAEEAAVFLALLGALLRSRLELGDPVRSGLQGLLLDQHGLR